MLCVSPSHNPPFAPSNYNSIHQSFAVTMATAMLGIRPRVARGHQSATDHHHLLHQNKLNQYFLYRGGDLFCDRKRRFLRHWMCLCLSCLLWLHLKFNETVTPYFIQCCKRTTLLLSTERREIERNWRDQSSSEHKTHFKLCGYICRFINSLSSEQ